MIPPGGYAWWYVDALSQDGMQGITLIAFIGSVFSPYYAWARRRGAGDPENFCALNVVLYGRPARWALTERGRTALRRDATTLAIGPSSLRWDGDALVVSIDERGAPWPRQVRGTVRVMPSGLTGHIVPLDAAGRHRWSPVAPASRVEVSLKEPALCWSGPAYFDHNNGDEPLETSFPRWHWSRAKLRDHTAILYDVERHDGGTTSVAIRVDRSGQVEPFAPPPHVVLPRTFWRIARATRADSGARVIETVVDAPFYARSALETTLLGERATAMHESLSLRRFTRPWVQAMLPFRMPRAIW